MSGSHLIEDARSCGPCTLCCKVLGVQELDKPKDVWCPHARKPQGCACYADRPQTCRSFTCLWLAGVGGEQHRPDRLHGVLCPDETAENLILMEDPGWPGHATAALREFIDRFVSDGIHHVIVFSRGRRELFARADRFEAMRGVFQLREVSSERLAPTDRTWALD